jgi:tripartite-type tricarboxylate transporter receptor subunit TctC
VAPSGTPAALTVAIHADVAAVLSDRAVQGRYAEYGVTTMPLDPAGFAAFLKAEFARWQQVGAMVRAAPP